jgi:1A family penicillin-binding protein
MSQPPTPDGDATRPLKPKPLPNEQTHLRRPPGAPENTVLSGAPSRPPGAVRPTQPVARPPQPPQRPPARATQTYAPPSPPPTYAPPPQPVASGGKGRWFLRGLTTLTILLMLAAVLVMAGGMLGYFWIASQLPPAETLRSRSFQFATTQILDREGNLLWEIIDPTGGRRTTVTLNQIAPDLLKATIATEDRFFYVNVGVDPVAIIRAMYYNVSEGEIVSGASTITQQLARNVLLSQEERTEQSLSRKLKEAVLAVEISRRYTKEQILEIYLNQIYYGNLAYGIEAAAQTYFGKKSADLTLAEAALLAGLPQSPAGHDPYTNPDGALARRADVLRLMTEAGYITAAQAQAAGQEPLNLRPLDSTFAAPHFVNYVRQELEKIVPPEYIYQAGLRVQTTLNPRLQAIAEEEVRTQVDALAGRNVTNGALVALDTATGEVLAMVGSKDFRDESISGQVNMAVSPRQPGSTFKPITYLTAFEKLNWTPSTLLMDVPVQYPDGAGGIYEPRNYDDKFHGPVSLRQALANSYNIPPLKTLEAAGIEAVLEMARRLGLTTLTRPDYGLSLTLGSGEVPVIEMTGAFQSIANGGVRVPPTAILSLTDSFGRAIEPARPPAQAVLRPEHAYLMTNILADNAARSLSFGPNSVLNLSRPAAAKTGTTNDFRDNWTIGYTPDIVTGVWVGNADRTPMNNISGLAGAGPIWHNFMERAHEGLPGRDFTRPEGIVEMEVCADSGTIPSPVCPERRREIFFREQPPLGPEYDMHQMIDIDRASGLRANEFCRGNVESRYFQVFPPDGRQWALEHGFEQPPEAFCPSTNIVAKITNPLEGSTVRGVVSLEGTATAANFARYQLELGVGTGPQAFMIIQEAVGQPVEQGVMAHLTAPRWPMAPTPCALHVFDQSGGEYEQRCTCWWIIPARPPSPTGIPNNTPTSPPFIPPTDTPIPLPARPPSCCPRIRPFPCPPTRASATHRDPHGNPYPRPLKRPPPP